MFSEISGKSEKFALPCIFTAANNIMKKIMTVSLFLYEN